MESLPDICDILQQVLTHYVPLAEKVYPFTGKAARIDKAEVFFNDWLSSQVKVAMEKFEEQMKQSGQL